MITKQLGEIADIQTGPFGSQLHNEDYVQDGTPIVTVEHLGNRRFTSQNLPMVSDEDKERLSKYTLQPGDMVFSRVGSVDRCSFVSKAQDGWLFSGRCLRVRAYNAVDSEWLYYYFCQERTKQFIRNIAVGATMPSINTKLMSEVPITYPEIGKQRAIASILSKIDDKIEENQRINNNLQQQAEALFKAWFVDFVPFGGTMPEDWQWTTLGNVAHLSAGGDKPKNYSAVKTQECSVPIFSNGIDCFGLYGYTDNAKIFEESVTVSARGTIGFVCLRSEPYVPIVRLVSVTPNKAIVSAKFIYLWLLNSHINGTGSTQQQLTVPDFSKAPILLPTPSIIQEFTGIVTPFYNQSNANFLENERLSVLRDTLLPKLMSGEIDVSDVEI